MSINYPSPLPTGHIALQETRQQTLDGSGTIDLTKPVTWLRQDARPDAPYMVVLPDGTDNLQRHWVGIPSEIVERSARFVVTGKFTDGESGFVRAEFDSDHDDAVFEWDGAEWLLASGSAVLSNGGTDKVTRIKNAQLQDKDTGKWFDVNVRSTIPGTPVVSVEGGGET